MQPIDIYDIEFKGSQIASKAATVQGLSLDEIGFGKHYGDHMFSVECLVNPETGEAIWRNPVVRPYGTIEVSPASFGMNYSQTVFEGMVAYKNKNGLPQLFRPEENWKRMNKSAQRLAMPMIPQQLFMDGVSALIHLDQDLILRDKRCPLYIRPVMTSTEEYIGVHVSTKFLFYVITAMNGGYGGDLLKVYVPRKNDTGKLEFVRAIEGGTGYVKSASNYPGTIMPLSIAKAAGCNEVLWLDAIQQTYIEEIGTMNAFFEIDGVIYTPKACEDCGTILPGITRKSAIQILRDMGKKVVEESISIDDLFAQGDRLTEAFGTGTAASVKPIDEINYNGRILKIAERSEAATSFVLKKTLDAIK